MISLEKLVEKVAVEGAATLPMSVRKVMEIVENPRSNAEDVAGAVSMDPVLTAKLLRTVNSSFFAFLSKVSDIRTAVARLGMKQVRNITLGLSVAKMFTGPVDVDGYSRPNVWKHSVAVGVLNELLAKYSKVQGAAQVSGEALLTGLVHDMGIILEDQYISKKFTELPALASSLKQPLYQMEKAEFGFDHQDFGAAILKKWNFPGRIVEAVGAHHKKFDADADLLIHITSMSELLAVAHKVGYYDSLHLPKDKFAKLAKHLKLSVAEIGALNKDFKEKLSDALVIFAIESPKQEEQTGRYEIGR